MPHRFDLSGHERVVGRRTRHWASLDSELDAAVSATLGVDQEIHLSDGLWRFALTLRGMEGITGVIVVSAARAAPADELFLLKVLGQQTAAAMTIAALIEREREQRRQLIELTEERARTIERLSRTVTELKLHEQIHDALTTTSPAGGREAGIARALHELTAMTVGVEDVFGHLRAWSGGAQPTRHRRIGGANREDVLRHAAANGKPQRDGDRLFCVVRPQTDILGVLLLLDPKRRADELDIFALEYATTVLAMELSHQRALAEADLRVRRDLVEDLLAGADDASAYARGEALGQDLRLPHSVAVLSWKDGIGSDVIAKAAGQWAAATGLRCLTARRPAMAILVTEDRPTVPVYAGFTPAETRRAVKAGMEPSYQGTFIGARRYVLDTFANTKSAGVKKRVSQFVGSGQCPACHGKRLKPEALSVTFEGLDIAELSRLTLDQLAALCATVLSPRWKPAASGTALEQTARRAAVDGRVAAGGSSHAAAPDVRHTPNMSDEKRAAAKRLVAELQERLRPLVDLGLGYLALARSTPTLSGGELQRVRLATQLSSQLFGVVYVLDEPSAGLHPRDRDALLDILAGLKRSGNSLFVVEHSLDVIAAADWLVDIGPGAGLDGGQILYSGPPAGLADVTDSVTRRYLFGDETRIAPRTPRERSEWLQLAGVQRNNLHNLSVSVPLRCLTAVTGVSGSGKSSLVAQALPEIVGEHLGRPVRFDDARDDDLLAETTQVASGDVVGETAGIRRVVCIDQKPIGRTPRSNIATYTGLFDHVRRLFATTPKAKKRGYKPGRFSFNVAGGRCPTCEGEGWVMVELLFLPSVYSPCPDCHGTRYNPATLAIRWHDKNIAEVLELSASVAREFFDGEPAVLQALRALCDVGLGYLRLGQPATELSGGEAQRVKLAGELQRAHRGDTLYLLDEPTAGLHPADTDRLLAHLHRLVDAGNTVVAAELDMRVVAQADYVIDMGPGAGGAGGRIVVAGTPAEVTTSADSATAPYLAAEFAQ